MPQLRKIVIFLYEAWRNFFYHACRRLSSWQHVLNIHFSQQQEINIKATSWFMLSTCFSLYFWENCVKPKKIVQSRHSISYQLPLPLLTSAKNSNKMLPWSIIKKETKVKKNHWPEFRRARSWFIQVFFVFIFFLLLLAAAEHKIFTRERGKSRHRSKIKESQKLLERNS